MNEALIDLFFSKKEDVVKFEKSYRSFQEDLRAFEAFKKSHMQKILKLPLNFMFVFWAQSLNDKAKAKLHLEHLKILVEEKIIPSFNEKIGALLKLEIKKLYEKTRANRKFSPLNNEAFCNTLEEFLQYLEEISVCPIHASVDPVKKLTVNKKVPHKQLLQFIEPLSPRDQLIAKVLYYGEPTLDETLELTCGKILLKKSAIQFRKKMIFYPKHIMEELKDYISKKKADELVFVNQKGKQIERPHLNNCFERAFQKSKIENRITPRDLLENRLDIF